MRINSVEQKGYANRIMDWKIYVRQDLTVAKASEFFYEFIGENSFRPVSELLLPEDAELLKNAVEADPYQPLELISVLHNLKDSVRNVYLRLEMSEQTENGIPLYQITLSDIHDLEGRNLTLEQSILKYRHFMTLEDVYFFEYLMEQDSITIYKYVNERAMTQFEGGMNDLIRHTEQSHEGSDAAGMGDQLRTFCAHLRNGDDFFEMEFVRGQEDEGLWKVKGARIPKKREMVAGIITPDRNREKEAYYLTPAARDAGTGLLNKRAWTEYTIEQLNRKDNSTRWLVIIDVDDFKHINDTYGHIFGDQVIRRVAEIMQVLVGQRGVIGRFGGDEYVILLEKVKTREQLKTLLKTIAKEFALAFDPKVYVTASIGVSEYPVDGSEYEKLMRKADKALYLAKEKGKNRHIIYEERLHGKLESDDMQNMAMAYAVSKEHKREVITKVITELCVSGVDSIVKKERLQQIRSLFDLDGITIYSRKGEQLVCRNGNYIAEAPDGRGFFEDEKYLALFGDDDNYAESNTVKLRALDPAVFAVMQQQEIGAFLQCLSRKEGVPNVIVNYDVFNSNRKWSDEDITLMTILGHCIGNLLNYSE